ncbi:cyclomaltodextrinase N-terminal domain-containing protein [Massilia sp. B-10]|nr:cyclomaltodextrinase N-terminal domain-containing protein [Massilia sp. B-10]
MKRFLTTVLFASSALFTAPALAQTRIDHLEPPFWWAKHAEPETATDGPWRRHRRARNRPLPIPACASCGVTRVANKNYLFIDLVVAPEAKPGAFDIRFGKSLSYRYQLRARESGSAQRQGFQQQGCDLPGHAGPLRQWRPGQRQRQGTERTGQPRCRAGATAATLLRHDRAPRLYSSHGLHPALAHPAGREQHA